MQNFKAYSSQKKDVQWHITSNTLKRCPESHKWPWLVIMLMYYILNP